MDETYPAAGESWPAAAAAPGRIVAMWLWDGIHADAELTDVSVSFDKPDTHRNERLDKT